MKTALKACLAAAALTATAGVAVAQQYRPAPPASLYRPDQAPVMTPAPKADPNAGNNAVVSSFRQWNRRNGNPTILVFWSRSLTDDSSDEFETYFAEVIKETPWTLRTAQVAGATRTTDGREQRIGSRLSESLQASFMDTLINSGGRVIDRNALMRKVSTRQARPDRMDKQYMESLAIQQGVQYLVEIVPDHKPSSSTGLTFLIKVTHLPTSTVRAQFASTGLPPEGKSRIVAGAYGFVRQTEYTNTVENVGAQIAYDIMGRFN